ncbi:MAG: GNAT family N-acetyltransferase [Candidatus Micrarchaeota archaeon]|nr:GNAT family N-acetyltransferase [Candidatus Micrarchaeota archaeon]
MKVRKADATDLQSIQEIAALLFPNSRSRFLPDDKYAVAERNGILIGFCHYRFREKTCFVAGLGVLAQYRNHGVGGQLLAEALFDADSNGIETTLLKVRPLNTAAKLYHQMGFFEKRSGAALTLVRKRPS